MKSRRLTPVLFALCLGLLTLLVPLRASAGLVVVPFQGVMSGGWIGFVNAPVPYSGSFSYQSPQTTTLAQHYALSSFDLKIGNETVPSAPGWIKLGTKSFEITAMLTGGISQIPLDYVWFNLYGPNLLPTPTLPPDGSFVQRATQTQITVAGGWYSQALYGEPTFGPPVGSLEPIPEPAALLCFVVGLGIVGLSIRKRASQTAS